MAKKSHEAVKEVPIYPNPVPTSSASDLEMRVRNLEHQVQTLAPLREILNQVAQIKRYFGGH